MKILLLTNERGSQESGGSYEKVAEPYSERNSVFGNVFLKNYGAYEQESAAQQTVGERYDGEPHVGACVWQDEAYGAQRNGSNHKKTFRSEEVVVGQHSCDEIIVQSSERLLSTAPLRTTSQIFGQQISIVSETKVTEFMRCPPLLYQISNLSPRGNLWIFQFSEKLPVGFIKRFSVALHAGAARLCTRCS